MLLMQYKQLPEDIQKHVTENSFNELQNNLISLWTPYLSSTTLELFSKRLQKEEDELEKNFEQFKKEFLKPKLKSLATIIAERLIAIQLLKNIIAEKNAPNVYQKIEQRLEQAKLNPSQIVASSEIHDTLQNRVQKLTQAYANPFEKQENPLTKIAKATKAEYEELFSKIKPNAAKAITNQSYQQAFSKIILEYRASLNITERSKFIDAANNMDLNTLSSEINEITHILNHENLLKKHKFFDGSGRNGIQILVEILYAYKFVQLMREHREISQLNNNISNNVNNFQHQSTKNSNEIEAQNLFKDAVMLYSQIQLKMRENPTEDLTTAVAELKSKLEKSHELGFPGAKIYMESFCLPLEEQLKPTNQNTM